MFESHFVFFQSDFLGTDYCVDPLDVVDADNLSPLLIDGVPTASPTIAGTEISSEMPSVLSTEISSEVPTTTSSEVPTITSTEAPTLSPTPLPALSYSNTCSPTTPCEKCVGDCLTDDDCVGELVCSQREGGEDVPGCSGSDSSSKYRCADTAMVREG